MAWKKCLLDLNLNPPHIRDKILIGRRSWCIKVMMWLKKDQRKSKNGFKCQPSSIFFSHCHTNRHLGCHLKWMNSVQVPFFTQINIHAKSVAIDCSHLKLNWAQYSICLAVKECHELPAQIYRYEEETYLIFVMGPGRVGHLWFGFGFGKFSLKMSNFSIFSLRVKKISLGWVKKYPGQRHVGLLFSAGQKYAWVGSRSHLYLISNTTPWFCLKNFEP